MNCTIYVRPLFSQSICCWCLQCYYLSLLALRRESPEDQGLILSLALAVSLKHEYILGRTLVTCHHPTKWKRTTLCYAVTLETQVPNDSHFYGAGACAFAARKQALKIQQKTRLITRFISWEREMIRIIVVAWSYCTRNSDCRLRSPAQPFQIYLTHCIVHAAHHGRKQT